LQQLADGLGKARLLHFFLLSANFIFPRKSSLRKMLAVFEKTVANSPEALQSPHSSESAFALKDGSLATHFASVNPNSVTLNFGSSGFVAYSLDNPDPRVPRSISSPLLFDYMLDLVKSLLFL
jgi:hypothetical protein